MAQSLNVVALTGNITDTPEIKEVGETRVARCSLALNRSRKNKETDEWESEVDYIELSAWGGLAEYLSKLSKGAKISVGGSLRQNRWQDDDGKNRSKVYVLVQTVVPAERKESTEDKPKSGYEKAKETAAKLKKSDSEIDFSNEPIDLNDIPF